MSTEDHTLDDKITDELKYNINLIHINPDEMKLLYTRMNPREWEKRYNIAFWLWELEEFLRIGRDIFRFWMKFGRRQNL